VESKATDVHKESFLHQNYNRSVNYTLGLIDLVGAEFTNFTFQHKLQE